MGKNKRVVALGLSSSLRFENIEELERVITSEYSLKKGEHLFFESDSFTGIYIVSTGALKTYTINEEGDEHIASFYMPGEVLGWGGIELGTYPVSAVAIEMGMGFEISFTLLDKLFVECAEVRQQLMHMMSRKIREDQQMRMLISNQNAEQRVAAFLIHIACRMYRKGFSRRQFQLPISRGDMSNYLGLAIETVSRIFTRFQKKSWMQVTGKTVVILEPGKLSALSGGRIGEEYKELLEVE